MKFIGYNRPLYLLRFDRRDLFKNQIFGWRYNLTPSHSAEIAQAKQVIYDGFKVAVDAGVAREKAGILVDEQFGADILRDAKARGFATACPVGKIGQEEFDFEYGEDFAKHIETVQPTFCNALVRYNPDGDFSFNRRQLLRLRRLSDYLQRHSQSRFMLELRVPPEKAQLDQFKGDQRAYDLKFRPQLMLLAIQQLQNCGIEPDVWSIEGLDRREEYERIVAAARRDGRDNVGCMVLGRGEDEDQVCDWLMTAAGVSGFIGFAAGRTIFRETLANLRAQQIGRERAVWEIARSFQKLADVIERFLPSEQSGERRSRNPVRNFWDGLRQRGPGSPASGRITGLRN
jgi:myo-inositol catabolism protein IolC